MAQGLGPLKPVWEAQMEFKFAGISLALLWLLLAGAAICGAHQQIEDLSLSHSAFQKYDFKTLALM